MTGWPVHEPLETSRSTVRQWHGGCDESYPRVNPATGLCSGCGEPACVICGKSACPDHRALHSPLARTDGS